MHSSLKTITENLFADYYLRKRINHASKAGMILYSPDHSPVLFVPDKILKEFYPLLKRDKKGKYNLHLVEVRKLHGNSFIKRYYKKKRKMHAI